MKQRLLVAALGVPLLLAILLLAPVWATALLAALLSAVGCYELMRAAGGTEWKLLAAMPAFAFALALAWADVWELGEAAAPAAFIAVVYALASAVVTHGRAHRLSFATVMAGIFSAVLLPAAFACLARLRAVSPALALTPFIGAFMSDTGAFFAGRAFGKHKLAPAVSPHKTVEGSVGGFIGSVAGMLIFHYAARAAVQEGVIAGGGSARAAVHLDIGVLTAVLLGLAGSLLGQLGDLSFSVIKREFGIKDYGRLFLEHGGVLDRFDSVLFVAPAYWLMFTFIFN